MIYFGLNDELAERLGLESTSEFSNVIKHIQAVAQTEIPPIAVIDLGTATVKPPLIQALVRVAKEKTAYAEVLIFVPREDRPKVEHEYFSAGVSGVFSGEAELREYLDTKRRVFSAAELIDDEDIDKLLEEMTGNLGEMLLEGPSETAPPVVEKLEVSPEDEEVLLREVQEKDSWEILWNQFEQRQEIPGDRPAVQRHAQPVEAPTAETAGERTEEPPVAAVEQVAEETPSAEVEPIEVLEKALESGISLDLSDIEIPGSEGAGTPPQPEEAVEMPAPEVGVEAAEEKVELVGPTTEPEPIVGAPPEKPTVSATEPPARPLAGEPAVPVKTEAAAEPPVAAVEQAAEPLGSGTVPRDILREVAAMPIAVQGPPQRPQPAAEEPTSAAGLLGTSGVGEAVCLECGATLDADSVYCRKCGTLRGERRPISAGVGVEAPGEERQGGLFSALFGGRKKQAAQAGQQTASAAQPSPAEQAAAAIDRRLGDMPDATAPPQAATPGAGVGVDEFSAEALNLLRIQRDPNEKPAQPKKALLSLRGGKPAVRGVSKRTGVALEVPIRFNPPKLVTVFSPKGGVGKTTVSLNMGAQLAMGTRNQTVNRGGNQQNGLDVVVVDMDLFQGGAHYRVADITEPNIISLIQNIGSIHSKKDLVTNYLLTHRDTRLRLLLRPATPSEARSFTDRHLTFVLKVLLLYFDLIILDCPPEAETKVTEKALELSDLLLLVTEPENVSLTNSRRMLPRLLQIKQQDQVKLVVNKWTNKCGVSWEQITRWFNYIETIGQIPEHTEFFMASANTMSLPLLAGNKSVLTGYVNLSNNVITSLNKLQRGRARASLSYPPTP